MSSESSLTLSTQQAKEISARNRERMAGLYVRRVLASTAPEAVRFQRQLINDEAADPALRFKASEAVLDRFMGKAAQEVRVGLAESRPIVFSEKLSALRKGFKDAEDAQKVGESPYEAFVESMSGVINDPEGVEF